MQVYTVAFMMSMSMYMNIPGVLPIHALQTCTYFQTLHLCIVFVYMCKCINRLADLHPAYASALSRLISHSYMCHRPHNWPFGGKRCEQFEGIVQLIVPCHNLTL